MLINKELKILAKDTVYYGMSNIIPKFLNWIMVFIYTRIFNENQYGIITELYTYASIINVILTFGMETTLFRFASNKEDNEKIKYYSNVFTIVLIIAIIFYINCIFFIKNISSLLKYDKKEIYILLIATILIIDAISSIPFSYLRLENKIKKFASIKIYNIVIYIFLNLWIIYVLPIILEKTINYRLKIDVSVVFIANLFASCVNLFFLKSEIKKVKININIDLVKNILKYSLPLLITQLSGILNDGLDRILLKIFIKNKDEALYYLGIYGANLKLALIIVLFTQAFRYAYEPFVFKKAKEKNSKELYAEIMKAYIIISLFFYLIVNFYIDIFKYMEGKKFWVGLNVVPVIMSSYILSGIAFNLSIWYKIIDKTYFGIIITLTGIFIKVITNILFIEKYNYMSCAWSNVLSYLVMIIISYTFEKKYYKIKYDIKSILVIVFVTILLIKINLIIKNIYKNNLLYEITKIILILIFILFTYKNLKRKKYES